MSYCRFSEADIYLYESVSGGFECCACSLTDEVLASTYMQNRMEVLFHVRKHRASGDYVPDDVDLRLLQEIKAENPDKSFSDLSEMYQMYRNELVDNFELFSSEADISLLEKTIIKKAVEHLRGKAEDAARSSRDFGRGYMHAVRELESYLDS